MIQDEITPVQEPFLTMVQTSPLSEDSVNGRKEEETLFEQLQRNSGLQRQDSIRSNGSVGSDDQRRGKIKPLLSFDSGDFRSLPRRKDLKEGEALKKNGKSKLLIDVSDANLCQTCGCSEFRRIFAGKREAQCGNCLHVHND